MEFYHSSTELYHYGVKGMRWGHRKPIDAITSGIRKRASAVGGRVLRSTRSQQTLKNRTNTPEAKQAKIERVKRAAKIGAAAAGTALAVYGTYKMSKALKSKAYTVAHARGLEASSKFVNDFVKNNGADGVRKAGNLDRYLSESNHEYALRSSKSTAAAVRTLLGKNREIPVAELWNMGINAPRFR